MLQSVADDDFHAQPALGLRLRLPNRPHLRPAISFDHGLSVLADTMYGPDTPRQRRPNRNRQAIASPSARLTIARGRKGTKIRTAAVSPALTMTSQPKGTP